MRSAFQPRWALGLLTWLSASVLLAADPHWAFQPLRSTEPPAIIDPEWKSPIDRYLRSAMHAKGLQPVALADRRTLLRRVTLDLTGLPPTPEEIAAFLADSSPQAWERVVERLLASPHYAERWGRHWLDVARYADTAGDGADYPVPNAYRYRNYVIRSFAADKPFDQFLKEQFAGDLLAKAAIRDQKMTPDAYADAITATGYLAIGKRFGYNVNTEFQHLDIADNLETIGRSVLGLSIGCARCHDHKYDPISTREYYGLYGILASSQFAFPGGEEHQRPANLVPLLPPEELKQKEAARQAELSQLDSQIRKLATDVRMARSELNGPDGLWNLESATIGKAPPEPWFYGGPITVLAEAQSPFRNVFPAGTRGVRVLPSVPNDGIRATFPTAFHADPGAKLHVNVDFRPLPSSDTPGAHRFFLSHGVITTFALQVSITADALWIRSGEEWQKVASIQSNEWANLQLDLDLEKRKFAGRFTQSGKTISFADKTFDPKWDGVIDTFINDGLGHVPGKITPHDVDNLAFSTVPFLPADQVAVVKELDPAKKAALQTTIQKGDAELQALRLQRNSLAGKELCDHAYGVMEAKAMNARIQRRGEPDKLGDEVPRSFLSVLGGDVLPASAAESGRQHLAEWLTRESNPLTPRVMVNRIWQHHFGRGIVATPSDFGVRGDKPTHPELLDWLAREFQRNGWSIKQMHRIMLHSRAYQLASTATEKQIEADLDNRWLSRFSRRRLDAESIRDGMLAVAGTLDRSMPTTHPFPPMSQWRFTIHNPFHAVYESKHRSVYLMVQRQSRHPYLALFDGADPNISTDVRPFTITPTQALYLMNDPFVHAQSDAFAKRMLAQPGDESARLRFAVESVTGQALDAPQLQKFQSFLANYRKRWQESKLPATQAESAAWAALGRVLMTSNASLYVD
ncbi:DUF1549 and DUF1553 domain-containing protein [Tuwongella immobilis]|uniref:DUF1553 domain-containing protein n=1 Tax=Tuwongella immobilis TaxID=692036 RepID=A0A6C2YQ89_9BACT|nr:DUF1549 and DUF1553 domain-containing protein [Tuwongella immobilis]VIP03481.1 Uncharacterized protein OS=Pirellula staleyi (strain ATCC 27377 / DSM 6068 / ICPB 4128) GN=Psta_3447 PE=4 SV=1: PSCyt2: PSD1 [Tuwongella immobilis]VTS04332.1 Uncharacterized protein OS=Pirellula staleyi (strain ATCC 27377 / DSM 6068 / ICPB 4128) GN=Psta_3447 PE=4 SV=1: PSCyt2: PSD1 [Tuwongella immobilis]